MNDYISLDELETKVLDELAARLAAEWAVEPAVIPINSQAIVAGFAIAVKSIVELATTAFVAARKAGLAKGMSHGDATALAIECARGAAAGGHRGRPRHYFEIATPIKAR